MKIIEPITNLGALSTNDAPLDALEVWEPIGRDLLNYIDSPIFDVVGNTMLAASLVNAGPVYIVNLVTGDVSNSGYSTANGVINIDISPDLNYAAIVSTDGGATILNEIISLSDGVVNYSASRSSVSGNYGSSPIDNTQWSSDSSSCLLGSCNTLEKILSANWSVSTLYSTDVNMLVRNVCQSASHIYLSDQSSNYSYQLSLTGSFVQRRFDLGNRISIKYDSANDRVFALYIDGRVYTVNQSTMALESIPGFDVQFFTSSAAFILTDTHIILRERSISPYWSFRLLSNFTIDKSMPNLPSPGESLHIATDYTVIQQPSGFAIFDSLDVPISQANPSVVTGDLYIYADNVYEVLTNNNDQPDTGVKFDPPTWLDRGKINPLRMFDGKLDSLTTSNEDLIIDITPHQVISGIALFNVDAAAVRVTMTDPIDGLVFDTGEISMIDNSHVNNWFDFYNAPYIKKSDFVSLSLPPFLGATTQVTLSGINSSVSVGEIVVGRVINIGVSQFGSSVGILDFSEKEQDQFGNFSILKRKFSKRADYDVKMPTNTVSGAQRTLSKFRATPVVWVGDVNREETIIYGYYKSFDIVLSGPSLSDTSILVEGL